MESIQMKELTRMLMELDRLAKEGLRMTTKEGISSVNTATKHIFPTLLYTLIWNKNTQKDQMESSEIPQQVVEEEEDQEKTLTRGLILVQKTSLRHLREMEAQLIPYAASEKHTWLFLELQIMMELTTVIQIWPTLKW